MNQMSCRSQTLPKIQLCAHQFQYARRPRVSVFSNQLIDLVVFSESGQSRSQDDQFSIISERHACPVNAFVAKPGAFKLRWIEIHNRFPDRRFEELEVDFERKRGCLMKAFDIVANEKSA